MRKISLIIALCLVALSIASLTFNINTRTGQAFSQKPSLSPKISEAAMYSAFFHFVVDLQRQATEIERGGDKGDSLRAYVQTQASLNDEEARKLDEIAAACVEEVSQQDAKALVVIQAFQSQFNETRTEGEWTAMRQAAQRANADFIEPRNGPCDIGCVHADWRNHSGGY